MSADQHNLKPAAPGPEPGSTPPNPKKVRSTRYDWAHDIAPAEPPDKSKPGPAAARRSLFQRVKDLLHSLLGDRRGGGRSPFDRDDGPDPMAA